MKQRVNLYQAAPEVYKIMSQFGVYTRTMGFSDTLIELIKIRASQLNGCAYCLDMHTKDARAYGETEQRIYLLSAWREAPFYTEEERAVLALTEAVTLVSENGVPDEVYEEVRKHFNEKQYVDLVAVMVAINGWNRFSIAVNNIPGSYKHGDFK